MTFKLIFERWIKDNPREGDRKSDGKGNGGQAQAEGAECYLNCIE